jgi:hypothetical protein
MLSGVKSGTEAAGQRRQGKDNCGGSDINVDRVAMNLADTRDRIFDLYRRRPGVFRQANRRQPRQHDGAQQCEDEPDGVPTEQRTHTDGGHVSRSVPRYAFAALSGVFSRLSSDSPSSAHSAKLRTQTLRLVFKDGSTNMSPPEVVMSGKRF